MQPIEYLHLQMKLEGIETGGDNLITRASPYVDEFPLVLQAHTSDQQEFVYLDSSLPLTLREKLLSNHLHPFNVGYAGEVFDSLGIKTQSGHFRTYVFPNNFAVTDVGEVRCFDQHDPRIVAFGFSGLADKVYAIEREGMILSACVSSLQNSESAEAWVFTQPDHRREGLALQVVTAWAGSLQREGIVPFYSHKAENLSSANLAGKLGLIHVFDETVIEKAD